jgi:hypothetical protein
MPALDEFVETTGLISIAPGATTVSGVGTLFAGRDREASKIVAYPAAAAPIYVGTVAAVEPSGVYSDNLALPLVHAYHGPPLVEVAYELVDGPAIANSARQAAVFARFAAHLSQNLGLVGNLADSSSLNFALVPNNSLFVDSVTRTIYQWRNGLLAPVETVGTAFNPRGAFAGGTTYAKNDMVETGGYIFVSNVNVNLGNPPNTAPASTAQWMFYPTTGVAPVLAALGVHGFIISPQQPSGGVDGDIWLVVA